MRLSSTWGFLAARVLLEIIMSERLELLCAELRAIDHWEWLYRVSSPTSEADELSHRLRQARREEIVSEIQVLFAKSTNF